MHHADAALTRTAAEPRAITRIPLGGTGAVHVTVLEDLDAARAEQEDA